MISWTVVGKWIQPAKPSSAQSSNSALDSSASTPWPRVAGSTTVWPASTTRAAGLGTFSPV